MNRLKKLRGFYLRYERYLIPGALLFGFVTDALTFHLINFTTTTLLLLFHLIFIGGNIVVINLYEIKKIKGRFFSYWRVLAPLFLQYSFGNLFSAFLIFYSHSGSFSASWPFIIVILFLMIGNEVFRKYNVRPVIQISVYFFAVFSYLSLIFPYLFNNISAFIFIASGLSSVFFIAIFIKALSSYVYLVKAKIKTITVTVGLVFLFMNFLYFANLIPPIPLSIKQIGVYHSIQRSDGGYEVETEDCKRLDRCFFTNEQRHIDSERGVLYLYSAVHAPEGMELAVVNEWQKYSDDDNKWKTVAEIPFNIKGGREGGYRWYSFYNTTPGYWRVNVKTERGQVIGRKKFHVIFQEGVEREVKEIF
jgi:hypothetical protein